MNNPIVAAALAVLWFVAAAGDMDVVQYSSDFTTKYGSDSVVAAQALADATGLTPVQIGDDWKWGGEGSSIYCVKGESEKTLHGSEP